MCLSSTYGPAHTDRSMIGSRNSWSGTWHSVTFTGERLLKVCVFQTSTFQHPVQIHCISLVRASSYSVVIRRMHIWDTGRFWMLPFFKILLKPVSSQIFQFLIPVKDFFTHFLAHTNVGWRNGKNSEWGKLFLKNILCAISFDRKLCLWSKPPHSSGHRMRGVILPCSGEEEICYHCSGSCRMPIRMLKK